MSAVVSLAPMQDIIVLGGVPSPGIARIRTYNSPRDWNIRKGYGYAGATIVYTGANLAKFEVDITLWKDPEHWLEWKAFSLLLAKPIPPVVTGLDILHPLLNMSPWNLKSVVIEDVMGFEESDYEEFTATIKFIEFRAPIPAIGKPVVSIPTAVNPPPTPEDADDLTMQALLKQIQAESAAH
jgi:hypothetical protein